MAGAGEIATQMNVSSCRASDEAQVEASSIEALSHALASFSLSRTYEGEGPTVATAMHEERGSVPLDEPRKRHILWCKEEMSFALEAARQAHELSVHAASHEIHKKDLCIEEVINVHATAAVLGGAHVIFRTTRCPRPSVEWRHFQSGGLATCIAESMATHLLGWLQRLSTWIGELASKPTQDAVGSHLSRARLVRTEAAHVDCVLSDLAQRLSLDITLSRLPAELCIRHLEAIRAAEFARMQSGEVAAVTQRQMEALREVCRVCNSAGNCSASIECIRASGLLHNPPPEMRMALDTIAGRRADAALALLAMLCDERDQLLKSQLFDRWREETSEPVRFWIAEACRIAGVALSEAIEELKQGREPMTSVTRASLVVPVHGFGFGFDMPTTETDHCWMPAPPLFGANHAYVASKSAMRRNWFLDAPGRQVAGVCAVLQTLLAMGDLRPGIVLASTARKAAWRVRIQNEMVASQLESEIKMSTFGVLTHHELPEQMRDDCDSELRDACHKSRCLMRHVSFSALAKWGVALQGSALSRCAGHGGNWVEQATSGLFALLEQEATIDLESLSAVVDASFTFDLAKRLVPWLLEQRMQMQVILDLQATDEQTASIVPMLRALHHNMPGFVEALAACCADKTGKKRADGSVTFPLQVFSRLPAADQAHVRAASFQGAQRVWPQTLCHICRPTGSSRMLLRLHPMLAMLVCGSSRGL